MSKTKTKVPIDTPLSTWERMVIDITSGKKKPKTKEEKELAKELKEMKKKGQVLNIPFN